jgi:murein L,D-transpeptidase YcbB/YkuD
MLIKRRHVIAAGVILAVAGAGINVSNPDIRKAAVAYAKRAKLLLQEPAGLKIIVNAPANRLYVYRDGVRFKTFVVSIGRRGFETPPGKYQIDHVVWNPWWHPPESNWAREEKPAPPGPLNPMGRAKLFFGNLLYVHGTPHENQLGEPASHGCVRMANDDVQDLARIVSEYGAPSSIAMIESLINNPGMTREVWLQNKVPLEIQYNIVEVADGNLLIHPDVYKRNTSSVRDQVVQALAQEGYDPASVNAYQLARLLDKQDRRGTSVTMSLDTLLAGAVASTGAGGGTH